MISFCGTILPVSYQSDPLTRELSSSLRSTSLDQYDIPILNHIVLPLRQHLPRRLDIVLVAIFLQHSEIVHNALDERLLEVTVNHAGRLRRFGPVPYRPLPHLVGAGGEERPELQRLAHRCDDLRQRGPRAEGFALFFSRGFAVEAGEALFEGYGDGDDGVAWGICFDPFADFGEVLILLSEVVFLTEIDEVDDGFGGQEEERVDYLDLCEEC